ncbi:TIR domain-containing protein [Pantoea agglomerans]|uniref:TIR domain-containing protein n=1 Tax=Enterobacter agglomerans TaxID=549 RepID=UPI003C7D7571
MKIFLAHAKEDEKKTEEIYDCLVGKGYSPWMDIKDIPAGVNWDFEIQKNFSNSNLIIIILSKISTQKNGYIRREINDAIEKLKYVKPDDIFVIPLLIDDAQVPSFISSKIQFIDFKRDDGWEILDKSLKLAAIQQNMELSSGITYGLFTLTSEKLYENYDKIPGHEIEVFYPKIASNSIPNSAKIISGYLSGRAYEVFLHQRTSPWPDEWPWNEENKDSYTSFYNEGFNVAFGNKNILSILHSVHWYGAGAAHPNSHFLVSNFICTDEDYAYKFSLPDIFSKNHNNEAIQAIKKRLIMESSKEFWEKTGDKPTADDLNYLTKGIEDSNLDTFTVSHEGITFHFAPYEIHCYALGAWQMFISFYDVIDYIEPNGIYSLLRNN